MTSILHTGLAELTAVNHYDLFLAKYDPAGNYLWAISMGGDQYANGRRIVVDSVSNVYFIGFFSGTVDFDPSADSTMFSCQGTRDAFVAKYNSLGELVLGLSP